MDGNDGFVVFDPKGVVADVVVVVVVGPTLARCKTAAPDADTANNLPPSFPPPSPRSSRGECGSSACGPVDVVDDEAMLL